MIPGKNFQLSNKMQNLLKSIKVNIDGPIWNDLLRVSRSRLDLQPESIMSRNFLEEIDPLITLAKASNWADIGISILSKTNLINLVKIYGRKGI